MNKLKFVKKLAEKLENGSIEYAEKLIDTVFETIVESLREDGHVSLGSGNYRFEVERKKVSISAFKYGLFNKDSSDSKGDTQYEGPSLISDN